jgi:hypothetical protein
MAWLKHFVFICMCLFQTCHVVYTVFIPTPLLFIIYLYVSVSAMPCCVHRLQTNTSIIYYLFVCFCFSHAMLCIQTTDQHLYYLLFICMFLLQPCHVVYTDFRPTPLLFIIYLYVSVSAMSCCVHRLHTNTSIIYNRGVGL